MPDQGTYRFRSLVNSPRDEFDGRGVRPVVFDIIAPDRVTSLLPDDIKLVLHINPTTMKFSYQKVIERAQTKGGFVEFHWGDQPAEIAFEAATGGFMRLYSGLSNVTGPGPSNSKILPSSAKSSSVGGTRRETIAYDKYLDFLALYKNNGAIYDTYGNIALQGQVRITFDGGSWWGYFNAFSVSEDAQKPYQFTLSAGFSVERERHQLRSVPYTLPNAQEATQVYPRTPTFRGRSPGTAP